MSVPLLATWPAMGEREKEIFWWKCVEVSGSWDFGKDWNFGKLEKALAYGGRKEIKEKEKEKKFI